MAEAGWLADPAGGHELRYWDGAAWTDHVSDAGTTSSDPAPIDLPPPTSAPPPPPAPPASGGGGWKDKLKSAAQQAATQGKQLADQAKTTMGEQQAKRQEQFANDPNTLWYGDSKSAAGKATGMSKAFYRITKDRISIDTGLLGVKSEQVPMWAIKDIDVRQNVMQRGKDIGDVVLRLEDPSYNVDPTSTFNMSGQSEVGMGRTSGEVILDNIEGPYQVRDLLVPLVSEARHKKTVERQSQYLHVNPGMAGTMAGMAAAAPAPPPTAAAPADAPQVDVVEQLRKLATLRDEGILSEEEFAAQKAKLLG